MGTWLLSAFVTHPITFLQKLPRDQQILTFSSWCWWTGMFFPRDNFTKALQTCPGTRHVNIFHMLVRTFWKIFTDQSTTLQIRGQRQEKSIMMFDHLWSFDVYAIKALEDQGKRFYHFLFVHIKEPNPMMSLIAWSRYKDTGSSDKIRYRVLGLIC